MDWKKLYLIPTHCNVNARIRFFQYQILQRTLLTNRKLWLFKLIDSENCDNCETTETITHLLIDCNHLRVIWTGVENWLNHNINEKIAFDKKAILLGCPDNSILVNYIFLIVKHEIYKSKWNKSKVTLQKILEKLKYYLKIDEYISTISIGKEKTTFTLVMLDPHMGEPIPWDQVILWVYPPNQKDFTDFCNCFNNVLHKLK